MNMDDGGVGRAHMPIENYLIGSFVTRDELTCHVLSNFRCNADIYVGGILNKEFGRESLPLITEGRAQSLGMELDALTALLDGHLPFSARFPQAISSDETWHFDSTRIPMPDKIPLCRLFVRLCTDLNFKDGNWNGRFSGQSFKFPAQIDTYPPLSMLLVKFLNSYNEQIERCRFDWDRRFTFSEIRPFREISPETIGVDTEEELERVSRMVSDFPQDRFVVRKNGSGSLMVNVGADPDRPKNDLIKLSMYCQNFIPSCSSSADNLRIQGGNMHVSGRFVFVGMDEYSKHEEEALEKGMTVHALILDKVFADNLSDAHRAIFIGTADERPRLYSKSKGFQPIFHTDMFFCPIGFTGGNDSPEFRYLFAKPDKEFIEWFNSPRTLSKQQERALQKLIDWFGDTADNLDKSLQEEGITPKRITVPLPLQITATSGLEGMIKRYRSFVNGLVSRSSDTIEYFMPQYVKQGTDVPLNRHDKLYQAQNKAEELISQGIPSVRLTRIFDQSFIQATTDSLRCRVKVLSRD